MHKVLHAVLKDDEELEWRSVSGSAYWAVQAWLLTPLTFAQHCISPLAAFTSGAYFLHNGRR